MLPLDTILSQFNPDQIPIILLPKIHLHINLSFPLIFQVVTPVYIKIIYEILGFMFPCHISSQTNLPWFDISHIEDKVLHYIKPLIPSFFAYMNRNSDD
jgi:hypothetical protein